MKRIRLKNLITESVTLSVSGASQEYPDLDTIGNLTWELNKSVLDKIFNQFTPQELQELNRVRVPEILAADGDGYFDPTGIMNFYIAGWPSRLLKETVSKILERLDLLGIKVGKPTTEQSNTYKSSVIRFPILSNENVGSEKPPELNMSNRSFIVLFHNILNLVDENDYGITISVEKLETAISHLTNTTDADQMQKLGHFTIPQTIEKGNANWDGTGGATFIDGGLSTEQLSGYIHKLVQMIQWAKAKGYKTISGA